MQHLVNSNVISSSVWFAAVCSTASRDLLIEAEENLSVVHHYFLLKSLLPGTELVDYWEVGIPTSYVRGLRSD